MIPHQWLIGGVAFAIGTMFLVAAITNHHWFFQLNKLRLLEGLFGRPAARWVCAVLGCALIVLGGLIVSGRLPRNVSAAVGKAHKTTSRDRKGAESGKALSNRSKRARSIDPPDAYRYFAALSLLSIA